VTVYREHRSVGHAAYERSMRCARAERQLALVRFVFFGLVAFAVLILLCAQAHAGELTVDAGPADAGDYRVVQVDAGDPAPFTGFELGWQGAEQLARAGLDAGAQPLAVAPAQPDSSSSCSALGVAAAVGAVVGFFVAKKVK
jgi:hypothetical protein